MDLFDPFYAQRVQASARRLDDVATQLRERARVLAVAAGDDRWDGDGARAFRHGAHDAVALLHHAAASMSTAVGALCRHAAVVADEQAARAAAQQQALLRLIEPLTPGR